MASKQHTYIIKCVICDNKFVAKSAAAKYCDDCRGVATKKRASKYASCTKPRKKKRVRAPEKIFTEEELRCKIKRYHILNSLGQRINIELRT